LSYPSTEWFLQSATIGSQPIAELSTSALHTVGQRVKAKDYHYGEVEFVYLPGAASVATGDLVTFDEKSGVTAQAVQGSRGPLAVAMSDCVAGDYGWFAVSGCVPVKTDAGSAIKLGAAFLCATVGAATDVLQEGEKVDGLAIKAQPSGGFVTCRLSAPSANGNESNTLEEKRK
jgi:hypothetical protein